MEPDVPASTPRRERGRRPRKKGKGGLIARLIVLAIPLGTAIVVTLLPEEQRQNLLNQLPEGVGGRILATLFVFGAMAALAWVVLPLVHHAARGVWGLVQRLKEKPNPSRILLWPVRLVVWCVWFGLQCVFAVNAFLIVLAALVGLVLTIRIIEPGFLPQVLQGMGS